MFQCSILKNHVSDSVKRVMEYECVYGKQFDMETAKLRKRSNIMTTRIHLSFKNQLVTEFCKKQTEVSSKITILDFD